MDPDDFIVYRANGRIEKYGWRNNESKSRLRGSPIITPVPTSRTSWSPESSGAPLTLEWHLDRIEDRFGNYVDIDYDRTVDPGVGGAIEVVPSEIRWTGFSPLPGSNEAPATPSRRIRFFYQPSPKNDIRTGYRAGIAIKKSRLLGKIQILAQDGLVADLSSPGAGTQHVKTERVFREYNMSYLPSTARLVDRLLSITECVFSSDGTSQCLDPITFGWSDVPDVPQFVKGDVAVDNTPDFSNPNTGTYQGDPHHPDGWPHPTAFVNDVYMALVGDFDGDGRTDVLYRLPALNPDGSVKNVIPNDWEAPIAQGDWYLRLGTPTGLGQRNRVPGLPSSIGGDWVFSPRVMDVDGDGKDEVLMFHENNGQPEYTIYRYTGCSPPASCDFVAQGQLATGSWLSNFKSRLSKAIPYLIGDMDGDGLLDLVRDDAIAGQTDPPSTQLTFGAGVPPSALPFPSFAVGRSLVAPFAPGIARSIETHFGDDRFVTDIDGHGQDEVLTAVYNSGATPITLSALQISPSVDPNETDAVANVIPTTLEYQPADDCNEITRYFVDLNGDGLADSLAISAVKNWPQCSTANGTISLSVNSGAAFRPPVTLTSPSKSSLGTSIAFRFSLPSLYIPPAVGIINWWHDLNSASGLGGSDNYFDPEFRYFDQGIRFGDLDQDGRTDLLVVGGQSGVQWLRPSKPIRPSRIGPATSGYSVVDLKIPVSGFDRTCDFQSIEFCDTSPSAPPCRIRTQCGGYGPRLIQVGDFNGDGLLDVVGVDGAESDVIFNSSNLAVYLQAPHLPDLVTSIDSGNWAPKRTIDYEYSGIGSSSTYQKSQSQCGWPQACLKSFGWVVKSATVEASDFDNPTPTRIVTDYRYEDARADRTGRGILGVGKFTQTMRDETTHHVFSRTTSEFDLQQTVCQDADHHMCAYVGTAVPSHTTIDIPVTSADLQIGTPLYLLTETTRHTQIDTQRTIKPLVPGSFGYKIRQSTSAAMEQEITSRPRHATTQKTLTSSRVTRVFDGFENVTSTQHETSADPLPVDGTTAAGQIVYSSVQKVGPLEQAPILGGWLISRYPQYQFVSVDPTLPDGQKQLTQTVNLTYEPNSVEVQSITIEPDLVNSESDTVSGFSLTSTFGRNARGSVTSITKEGSGSQRVANLLFDPNDLDQIFPATTTDALGHSVSSYPDAVFGLAQAMDDSNGIRTEYQYDALGRLIFLKPPGGTEREYFYSTSPIFTPGSRFRSVCETSDVNGMRCAAFDPVGHLVEITADGFDQVVRTDFKHDELGGLVKQSLPFAVPSGWLPPSLFTGLGVPAAFIEYTRDGLERVIDQQRPGPTQTSPPYHVQTAYDSRRSTVTDERSIQTTSDTDAKGRVTNRSTIDPATGREISIGYKYWHFNLPRIITHPVLPASQAMTPAPAPLITSFDYDVIGRLQSVTDPDSGTTTALYNAFGEIKRQEDAAGGITTFTYDDLGRITWIDTPGNPSYPSYPPVLQNPWAQHNHIVYDTAPNGIGRIAQIVSNEGIVINAVYDPFGRQQATAWTVPGISDPLLFSYDYNSAGQVEYLNYPGTGSGGPLRLQYSYAKDGEIRTISDATNAQHITAIWQQVTRDAAGHSTEEQFGDNEDVKIGYDFGLQLQSRHAQFISSGTVFQDLEYNWDPGGLLHSREDHNLTNPISEAFSYDFLGRLADWQVTQNDATCASGASTTEWKYRYDDLGNLRLRETIANLPCAKLYPSTRFDYTSAVDARHPHAPKALTTRGAVETLTYDGAGHLISGKENTYVWTPFGLPRTISRPQLRSVPKESFDYDGAGARTVISLSNRNNKPSTRIVDVGGLFEVRTDGLWQPVQRQYNVVGPGGVVAQVLRNPDPASQTMNFIHPDHLGSPDAVTSAGSVIERGKYEPFGNRRFPSTLGDPVSQPHSNGATIGFTGLRPDDEFGLIYMTGRLYDPDIEHFISPDPIMSVEISEGLNGFSYTRNSPLSFTDRSGFQELGLTAPNPGATPEVQPVEPVWPVVQATPPPGASPPEDWGQLPPEEMMWEPSGKFVTLSQYLQDEAAHPFFGMFDPPSYLGLDLSEQVIGSPEITANSSPDLSRQNTAVGVPNFPSSGADIAKPKAAVMFPISIDVFGFTAIQAHIPPVPIGGIPVNELESFAMAGIGNLEGEFKPYLSAIPLARAIRVDVPGAYGSVWGGKEFSTAGDPENIIGVEGGVGSGIEVFSGAFEVGPNPGGRFEKGVYGGVSGGAIGEHGSLGLGFGLSINPPPPSVWSIFLNSIGFNSPTPSYWK